MAANTYALSTMLNTYGHDDPHNSTSSVDMGYPHFTQTTLATSQLSTTIGSEASSTIQPIYGFAHRRTFSNPHREHTWDADPYHDKSLQLKFPGTTSLAPGTPGIQAVSDNTVYGRSYNPTTLRNNGYGTVVGIWPSQFEGFGSSGLASKVKNRWAYFTKAINLDWGAEGSSAVQFRVNDPTNGYWSDSDHESGNGGTGKANLTTGTGLEQLGTSEWDTGNSTFSDGVLAGYDADATWPDWLIGFYSEQDVYGSDGYSHTNWLYVTDPVLVPPDIKFTLLNVTYPDDGGSAVPITFDLAASAWTPIEGSGYDTYTDRNIWRIPISPIDGIPLGSKTYTNPYTGGTTSYSSAATNGGGMPLLIVGPQQSSPLESGMGRGGTQTATANNQAVDNSPNGTGEGSGDINAQSGGFKSISKLLIIRIHSDTQAPWGSAATLKRYNPEFPVQSAFPALSASDAHQYERSPEANWYGAYSEVNYLPNRDNGYWSDVGATAMDARHNGLIYDNATTSTATAVNDAKLNDILAWLYEGMANCASLIAFTDFITGCYPGFGGSHGESPLEFNNAGWTDGPQDTYTVGSIARGTNYRASVGNVFGLNFGSFGIANGSGRIYSGANYGFSDILSQAPTTFDYINTALMYDRLHDEYSSNASVSGTSNSMMVRMFNSINSVSVRAISNACPVAPLSFYPPHRVRVASPTTIGRLSVNQPGVNSFNNMIWTANANTSHTGYLGASHPSYSQTPNQVYEGYRAELINWCDTIGSVLASDRAAFDEARAFINAYSHAASVTSMFDQASRVLNPLAGSVPGEANVANDFAYSVTSANVQLAIANTSTNTTYPFPLF